MAVTFTGITPYVDEHKLALIHKLVLTAPSVKLMNIQTGIKDSATINILTSGITFGDLTCGFNPLTAHDFTQRKIQVGGIKVEGGICSYDFLQYWIQQQVRIAAGKESLGSLEADFVNDIIMAVNSKLEIALYQGDTASSDPNLNKFDGLLKIIGKDANPDNMLTPAAGTSAYATTKLVYAALPNTAYKRGNVAILMGTDTMRQVRAELTDLTIGSCCMLGAENERKFKGFDAMYYPNSKTIIVGVEGLDGTGKIIGASLDNLYYGTDLESDSETIKFWFDDTEDMFLHRIRFMAGTQVAFPDEIILATVPAAA